MLGSLGRQRGTCTQVHVPSKLVSVTVASLCGVDIHITCRKAVSQTQQQLYEYSDQGWAVGLRKSVFQGEDPFSEARISKSGCRGVEGWVKKPSVWCMNSGAWVLREAHLTGSRKISYLTSWLVSSTHSCACSGS